MRRNRYKSVILPILGILIILIGIPVWMTVAEVRQQHRDRALLAAIKRNDTRAAVELLEQGADPNARDEPRRDVSVWRLLLDRLQRRHPAASVAPTALLIALRPLATSDANSDPPIPDATYDPALIRALLDRGAKVNAADKDGNTALMLAIDHLQHAIAHLLLTRGANVNAVDRDGNTVLMRSTSAGTDDIDVTMELLHRGADLQARDADGQTPLHCAVYYDNLAATRLFLDHGANINARDNFGMTPLMRAAKFREMDIVKLLLARGADVRLRDLDGRTCLDYAKIMPGTLYASEVKQNGGRDPEGEAVARVLKQAGAR